MSPSDIQRYLLFGALALLSFILLVEWQQFTELHKDAKPATTDSSIIQAGTEGKSDDSELESETSTSIPLTLDPELNPPTSSAQPLTKNTDTEDTKRIITVTTDSLRAHIDLQGGDLVRIELLTYFSQLDRPDLPFVLLENDPQRSYIAQSGLIGPDGIDQSNQRALYTSVRKNYELAATAQSLSVELTHQTSGHVKVTKRYIFRRNSHLIRVEYEIDNQSDQPWRAGLFAQIRRDASADPSIRDAKFSVKPFLGFAVHTPTEPYKKLRFKELDKDKWNERIQGGWLALVQHYFISAWIPDSGLTYSYSALKSASGNYIGRFTSPLIELEPGALTTVSAQFYAGPKDQYRLQEIAPSLDLTVDYGWLWWIAQPLFALLHLFATGELVAFGHSLRIGSGLGNWGWAIIMLTVLIKALFFKLSATSYRSMANMRKLQPKMLELRERFGEDRQKLSQATMELYRKEKVNPLGGCLPIVIQMPVFIALYWVLLESVELRQAPFIGWIRDMSVMDPYFVLPILMGISMFVQQRLNPPPPDPMQAKIFQIMPIMFTVFFLWFPSGLVLYWLVNNLLSILQQWIIARQIERAS